MLLMPISKLLFRKLFWKIYKPTAVQENTYFTACFLKKIVGNRKVTNCNVHVWIHFHTYCLFVFLFWIVLSSVHFLLRSFYCWFLIALNMLRYIIFCLSWMIQIFFQFTKFKFVITEDFICYVWFYSVSLFFYCFHNYFMLTKILSNHEWINIW